MKQIWPKDINRQSTKMKKDSKYVKEMFKFTHKKIQSKTTL